MRIHQKLRIAMEEGAIQAGAAPGLPAVRVEGPTFADAHVDSITIDARTITVDLSPLGLLHSSPGGEVRVGMVEGTADVVALKIRRADQCTHDEGMASGLRHPGLVEAYGVWTSPDNRYRVHAMELCSGGDLLDLLIEHEGGMAEEEIKPHMRVCPACCSVCVACVRVAHAAVCGLPPPRSASRRRWRTCTLAG